MSTATREFADKYIPVALWGRDHWSTLAYLEMIEVDHAGILVCYDPRMRHGRRNFRIMPEMKRGRRNMGVVMDLDSGSVLRDDRVAVGHDDWHCVQDMAAVGLFDDGADAVEPGETLHLSELGREVIAALRAHKAGGGKWQNFEVPLVLSARVAKLEAEALIDAAKEAAEERQERLLAT